MKFVPEGREFIVNRNITDLVDQKIKEKIEEKKHQLYHISNEKDTQNSEFSSQGHDYKGESHTDEGSSSQEVDQSKKVIMEYVNSEQFNDDFPSPDFSGYHRTEPEPRNMKPEYQAMIYINHVYLQAEGSTPDECISNIKKLLNNYSLTYCSERRLIYQDSSNIPCGVIFRSYT